MSPGPSSPCWPLRAARMGGGLSQNMDLDSGARRRGSGPRWRSSHTLPALAVSETCLWWRETVVSCAQSTEVAGRSHPADTPGPRGRQQLPLWTALGRAATLPLALSFLGTWGRERLQRRVCDPSSEENHLREPTVRAAPGGKTRMPLLWVAQKAFFITITWLCFLNFVQCVYFCYNLLNT